MAALVALRLQSNLIMSGWHGSNLVRILLAMGRSCQQRYAASENVANSSAQCDPASLGQGWIEGHLCPLGVGTGEALSASAYDKVLY